jgi:transcriptional regulator with XRE-family HTH domain
MGSIERPIDRASQRTDAAIRRAGVELRAARRDRNVSQREVGRSIGLSASAISRIERGLVPEVTVIRLAQLAESVGLEVSIRLFPGGQPIRDAAHAALLARFRSATHPDLRWGIEVPLPGRGDQRAWDAMLAGPGWRYGVEAETSPKDGQALARRLAMKLRDGGVDGILLTLPRTRRVREFLTGCQGLLAPAFPLDGPTVLARLAAGLDPGGSAIVLV